MANQIPISSVSAAGGYLIQPEYRDLLLSYSGHRAMEPLPQRGLLACIAHLIDDRYRGRVTKRYMNEMAVAKKL